MSRQVGIRKRILVAATAVGIYLVCFVFAEGLAQIAGTSRRVGLVAVTAVVVGSLVALGIRTRRSHRE
jgi:hypothetical protein